LAGHRRGVGLEVDSGGAHVAADASDLATIDVENCGVAPIATPLIEPGWHTPPTAGALLSPPAPAAPPASGYGWEPAPRLGLEEPAILQHVSLEPVLDPTLVDPESLTMLEHR